CEGALCVSPSRVKNKVDVLFVLDDSPAMGPMLDAWRASLPRLVAALDALATTGSPIWYHFGVVTGDLGAGVETLPALGCRPDGDGAKLHTGGLTPAGGVHYLDDNLIAGTTNIFGDIAAALDELADVGAAGCAFQSPLEAAYRALHDYNGFGFLRSDALLVVVFVGNSDDCSVAPTSDLFDGSAAGVSAYGTLDRFRCTQFGIACNGAPVPPTSVSGLTGCTPRAPTDGGKLLDAQRYIDFLTNPAAQGGVKVDPDDVALVAVTAPSDPVGVIVTSPCSADASVASCPQLDHSCTSASDARFFGDPAVRLGTVIQSARNVVRASVCEQNDDAVVDAIGNQVTRFAAGRCLAEPLARRSDGTPDCIAEDVTANPDGSTSTAEIPSCAENGHVTPCWQLVDRLAQYDAQACTPPSMPPPPTCTLPQSCQPVTNPVDGTRELYTIVVARGTTAVGTPALPPADTATRRACATPASVASSPSCCPAWL
ncbi:MAG TPA: hypothetical protein VHB97_27610, partial [Polyangia bacterium]|nr:hypothetical protein [Polyangia bacterium]